MAATYRIVVSSINYYNSVVVDRRVQQTVHYCNGPCGAIKHGLSCTVAHHSICAELLDSLQMYTDRSISYHESTSKLIENSGFGPAGYGEDFNIQVVPRVKKGSAIQSSTSLKDITGEAINLASGKMKEFSFEKVKYSSSHVTFRKGRKVRPDSFSRRSADLDVIYGHFGNDENCPPPKSTVDEQKLNRSISLEQNLNNAASFYLNNLTEENLIARILEKTKTDSNASGEDIKACLDILLKCSEDLKKCTDIIKQCIKRKSMSGDGEDAGNPDAIYRTMMARLSSYLKRLPFDLDLGHTGRSEHNDLSELVNTLHGLQQRPFSPFGNEQPPRYEDVVQNPPSTKVQSKSLSSPTPESIDHKIISLYYPISTGRHNASTPSSNSIISKDTSMETLFIEEDNDSSQAMDRTQVSSVSECRKLSTRHDITSGPSAGISDKGHPELVDLRRNGTVYPLSADPENNQVYIPLNGTESRLLSNPARKTTREGVDDIDKLLMDLECLSQNMQKEPPLPPKQRQIQAYQKKLQPVGSSGTNGPLCQNPSAISSTKSTNRNTGESGEEDDGALLLRILESIESFAQELVDCGSGTGTRSKEREVMRLLQDTLAKTEMTSEIVPAPAHEAAPGLSSVTTPVDVPLGTPASVLSPFTTRQDTGSSILIQQTPEVIRLVRTEQAEIRDLSGIQTLAGVMFRTFGIHWRCTCALVVVEGAQQGRRKAVECNLQPSKAEISEDFGVCFSSLSGRTSIDLSLDFATMMIKDSSLREDPDLRGELEFLARGCDFVLPSRFKKRLKSFQRTQIQPEKKPVSPPIAPPPAPRSPSPPPPAPPPPAVNIPRFYFPTGLPNLTANIEEAIAKVEAAFAKLQEEKADIYEMSKIAKACGCPLYWKAPMFHCAGGERTGFVSVHSFIATWRNCYDDASKFVYLLAKPGCTYLEQEDFIPLLQTLALLEEEDDINQITDYFSYEHFYVIYCKFWELDTDHDLFIDPKDLSRYNDHEEDKKNPTSIEYWFRCMDLDGDGVLSMYELEYFYEEQCERMEGMGIEPLPFQDLLCQMLDLVKPESQGKITLRDLKRCRMAHIFFDTFFNLDKYLDHEQRDPFSVQKDVDSEGPEPSDWDKYASEEYEILVAEETVSEHLHDGSFEDDYDCEELPVTSEIGNKLDRLVITNLSP
ncbi:Serine/threonine-protein phosphatase 2A regulatory subunit B'' subunit alpha [Bagarius yarrelli]|uniref:Serine/threonine-protein phosphatase 2A regulatory subunit B'' subunit alpha n=1 Tax=Bagarius yarrelli TaxID=175774 RepID=A0A556VBG8_BAGYA|nr:Serine/threonine-protein phosphatase 2A regulatory subunit B'' subunit alpha [Bagarius yarrelli]